MYNKKNETKIQDDSKVPDNVIANWYCHVWHKSFGCKGCGS